MGMSDDFATRGYAIARGMFSGPEMQSFIEEIRSSDRKKRDRQETLDAGAMRFYSNLFYDNPRIQAFLTQPSLIDFLVPVIGPDFWVRWDQAVAKGPMSGVFPWHQDNGYNNLGHEHFQLWIALSKMTPENGGLWIVPGSHKRRLPHRAVGNHMEAEGSAAYDAADAAKAFIAADAGDVVLFSSLALHKTYENTTDEPRWAYVAEYMRSSHYDPTVPRPYFNAAQNGKPYPVFTSTLPGSRDPRERLATLPLVARLYWNAARRRIKAMALQRARA
jgi:ectoine hydroxylase-related dioxygenase (phytanoyl-CoA dioxygenase family)